MKHVNFVAPPAVIFIDDHGGLWIKYVKQVMQETCKAFITSLQKPSLHDLE